MNAPSFLQSRRLHWLAVAGAVTLVAGLIVGYETLGHAPRHASARTHSVPPPNAEPTTKQKAAAEFAYPASVGALPGSITIVYDAAKDRTKMTFRTREVRLTPPSGTRVSNVELKFVSEFAGQTRRADAGELSVQCLITLVTSAAGTLAPSTPPGDLTADGSTFKLRAAFEGESGYKSRAKPDGVHEALAFKIFTKDLIKIVAATNASGHIGALGFTLSAAQLTDLREFAARMDPTP